MTTLTETITRELLDRSRDQNELQRQGEAATDELESKKAEVESYDSLLGKARELEGMGFGLGELSRLRDLLADIAAERGLPPGKGVGQFFETIEGYKEIIGIELEAKSARSRAEEARAEVARWEAEVKSREAQTRA